MIFKCVHRMQVISITPELLEDDHKLIIVDNDSGYFYYITMAAVNSTYNCYVIN